MTRQCPKRNVLCDNSACSIECTLVGYTLSLIEKLEVEGRIVPHARGELYRDAAEELKRALEPAFKLTADLCALPETTLKDGRDYIRRDRVMDLIASWRRAIDNK